MSMFLPAVLAGLAAAIAVYAMRDWCREKWHQDIEWLQAEVLRFTPETVNVSAWLTAWYVLLAALLCVLCVTMANPAIGVLIWLILARLPKYVARLLWHRRRLKIDEQLPEAIILLSNSVGAGFTLVQAIEKAAQTCPEPVQTEFRIMTNRYNRGANLEATIQQARDRLKLPNFNLFTSAMLVNRELGGNVGMTLDRTSKALVAVEQMKRKVKAATSTGRTNIKVLAVSPLIMLGLIRFMDAEGVDMVFSTVVGQFLLVIAGVLTVVGVYWAYRIVNADV